jgi:hypothetical protein
MGVMKPQGIATLAPAAASESLADAALAAP